MQVTIIISNYNYEQYVNSAIESCLAQTMPCKIIVVDDASTDSSWDVIRGYCPDGVKAVRLKENSEGNARGKNIGIAMTETPYVTCLDADDMLLPDSVSSRMPFPKSVDFVHGWSIFMKTIDSYSDIIKQPNVLTRKFKYTERCRKLLQEEATRWTWAIEASTVLAPMSLYHEYGLYDEIMQWSIDREMWWRWLSHGAQKLVVPKFVSIYRRHKKQLTQDRKRKDPRHCAMLLKRRQTERKKIHSNNTLLLGEYSWEQYVDEVQE